MSFFGNHTKIVLGVTWSPWSRRC